MNKKENFYEKESYKNLANKLDYEQKDELAILVCEAIRFGIDRMYKAAKKTKEDLK